MLRRVTAVMALVPAAAALSFGQVSPAGKNALVQLSGSIRDLTRRVAPAVVEVVVNGFGSSDDGGRGNQISRQHSSGSGVILDPAGYIITNAHVVQGAISVKVLLATAHSFDAKLPQRPHVAEARIVGIDRDSDLALLKTDGSSLPSLTLADSDELRQGDLVLAIGSPLGFHNSVSIGVVSSPGRAINDENPILYIQTDATINPGNSGGALVNTSGTLVGLSTFIVSQSGGNEGLGFALPSNVVRNVYQQLRKRGRVSRGTVGMFVQDITPSMAKGLSLTTEEGVVVADVEPEGPADLAGLKRRDVVLSLNGNSIEAARQFDDDVNRRRQGEKIRLEIQRGVTRIMLTVEVQEHAAPWDPLADMVSLERNLVPRLGILCIEIDQRVASLLPDLRRQYGLIVAAKSPEGQAQFIDLRPGDIIHAVNNLQVSSLEIFRGMIGEFHRGDAVVLQIERDGRFQFIAFEIE